MALFEYQKDCQRFIRDSTQQIMEPEDLTQFINRARREIAGRTQAIRVLTPIQGSVTTVTVGNQGTGYTQSDTFTFNSPDAPSGAAPYPGGRLATAGMSVNGLGQIEAINVIDGGDGYFMPSGFITTSTGSGATFTIQTSPLAATTMNQEVYNFSSIDLSRFPGVKNILAVRSVGLIYANYRYLLIAASWSSYQAYIRQYPYQYSYVPTCCSQFGQGVAGSLYMYPIASQPYQMEWDATALPIDLQTDQDVEAIPEPWTDAVALLATSFCYMSMQNLNAASFYSKLADEKIGRYSFMARPGRIGNVYGRSFG